MPKKINKELSRHPGGRRPLLDMESPQDFPHHSERSEESQKEIAQGVDLCETASVPLRDDMVISHPERSEGSL